MRFLCWEISYIGFPMLAIRHKVRQLLKEGQRVRAVKVYKDATGKNITDSIDDVKRIGRRMNRWPG